MKTLQEWWSDVPKHHRILIFVLSCVLIISAGLFGGSWDTVEPNNIGLDYNGNTLSLDSEVYGPGRYMIGLGHKFIRFPTTYQTVDYSEEDGDRIPINVFADGFSLDVEISYQYQLLRDNVYDLYRTVKTNYHKKFVDLGETAIKNTATQFKVKDYFERRLVVAKTFANAINETLQSMHAVLRKLQIRRVILPSNLEDKYIDTQVAKQEIITKEIESEVVEIEGQTSIEQNAFDAQITDILGAAEAKGNAIKMAATTTASERTLNAESLAYKELIEKLNFTVADLNKYFFGRTLRSLSSTHGVMVGFENAIIEGK